VEGRPCARIELLIWLNKRWCWMGVRSRVTKRKLAQVEELLESLRGILIGVRTGE